MPKFYECVLCSKRTKPKDRRYLDGDVNKPLRKFLTKSFFIDINCGDVICNKCRQKYYYTTNNSNTKSNQKRHNASDEYDTEFLPSSSKSRRPSETSPLNITLPLRSTGKSHSSCFVCKRLGPKLFNVPVKARHDMFLLKSILIPAGTRCCPVHINDEGTFSQKAHELMAEREIGSVGTQFNRTGIVHLIEDVRDMALRNKNKRIDFDNTSSLKDQDFINLTGLTKAQFDELCSFCPSIRDTHVRSRRTCVGILLTKLRSGMSNKLLSTIFNIGKSSVQKAITSARKDLMENFTNSYVGFGHISREEVITNHTRPMAQTIFGNIGNTSAIVVLDGTYVYVQKSQDYTFQRRSYSLHKHRPLVKPMMIVSTTGYIISVLGPYLADAKNNDANILTHAIKTNTEEITSWLQEDDILVVDRGFRDASDILDDLGLRMKMPVFLKKGQKQHSTEEANASRLVTKIRWVVESANGRLKQWKYISNILPNSQIPFVGDYIRIIAALCNKFFPPLSTGDKENDDVIGAKMLHLAKQKNELKIKIEEQNLDRRSGAKWEKLDAQNAVSDFPILSEDQLRELTLGVYQIKQAKAYTKEHMNDDGDYIVYICKCNNWLIQAKLQSRHTSNKKYSLWIEYGEADIKGWYCLCKAGSRVVGMCAHIASVIWFLSHARHQEMSVNTKRGLLTYVEDASKIPLAVDESDDEDSDN